MYTYVYIVHYIYIYILCNINIVSIFISYRISLHRSVFDTRPCPIRQAYAFGIASSKIGFDLLDFFPGFVGHVSC